MMRIHTKTVWQWVGDELVQVEDEFFEYDGPVDLCGGSGGGGSAYYSGLQELYGVQKDSAKMLADFAQKNVLPRYERMGAEYDNMGSLANQESAAQDAMARAQADITGQQQAMQDNFASLGIDPSDERYQRAMQSAGVMNAANITAAGNQAREGEKQNARANQQWLLSLGMGTPSQANQAYSAAANTLANAGNMYNQAQAGKMAGYSGAVQAANSLVSGWDNITHGADGGLVRLKQGGYVQRMAAGGFLQQPVVAPPPVGMSARPQPMVSPSQSALIPKSTQMLGSGLQKAGDFIGSKGLSSFGSGMQEGAAHPLSSLQNLATSKVDTAMKAGDQAGAALAKYQTAQANANALNGVGATEAQIDAAQKAAQVALEESMKQGSIQVATEGAAAGVTEGVGSTLAGAGAEGLGMALGSAIPIIGWGAAAYGLGNALGWWADGGEVTPYSHGARGGEVDGPGGPKSDDVPAMLSDGEFVMPVGAVKYFGLDRLEKMRQKGLEFEKTLGIGLQRR